jgi:hypothetical protein
MTIQDRMNDVGFEFDTEWATYTQATEHAIANFTGEDDIDPATIELVADLARQAVEAAKGGQWNYFNDLLEKSSTYVQTDLDESSLADYVAELEEQLEDYGLL